MHDGAGDGKRRQVGQGPRTGADSPPGHIPVQNFKDSQAFKVSVMEVYLSRWEKRIYLKSLFI